MGEAAVEIGEKELKKIGTYVKKHLPEWMGELRRERELDLVERIVRVEEEVKSLREVMETRFAAVYERFDAVDQRFESMQEHMETRFEAANERFKSIDQRFESMQQYMDKRFETVDKRFSQLQWMMGIGFTLMAALMGVLNFF